MLTVNASPHFKRSFKKVPISIQEDLDSKIDLFAEDPFEPSLRTHKLKGKLSGYYSFYLRNGYRVIFRFDKLNEIILLDIGKHDKYKRWRK